MLIKAWVRFIIPRGNKNAQNTYSEYAQTYWNGSKNKFATVITKTLEVTDAIDFLINPLRIAAKG